MAGGWRYKLAHIGDVFADMLETTVYAAQKSATSVVIEWQARGLRQKKNSITCNIGKRVVEMRQDAPDILAYDNDMVGLYDSLDLVQGDLDTCMAEKAEIRDRLQRSFRHFHTDTQEAVDNSTVLIDDTENWDDFHNYDKDPIPSY